MRELTHATFTAAIQKVRFAPELPAPMWQVDVSAHTERQTDVHVTLRVGTIEIQDSVSFWSQSPAYVDVLAQNFLDRMIRQLTQQLIFREQAQ